MSLQQKAVDSAKSIATKVDPYVPQFAKDGISYAASCGSSAASYTADKVNYGIKTVNGTVDYGVKTVTGTVDYGVKTVTGTVDYAGRTVGAAQTFVHSKATDAFNFGKVVVNGATTTITSYTPGPVLSLVQSASEGVSAVRADPVGAVKPYVPTFVIHAGEKTYEVVAHAGDVTQKNISATTGMIVTKVNGIVHSVTSVPAIGSLIEKINSITAPILKRFGVTKPDGSVEAQEPTAAKEQ